jgi:hypothetical protein
LPETISRILFLKSATLSFLFDHVWTLSGHKRGKYLHILAEIDQMLSSKVLRSVSTLPKEHHVAFCRIHFAYEPSHLQSILPALFFTLFRPVLVKTIPVDEYEPGQLGRYEDTIVVVY